MREKDKLRKRKKWLWMAGGILLLVIVAAGLFLWQYPYTKEFGTSGMFSEGEVKRLSGELVGLISNQEYEEVLQNYASDSFSRKVEEKDLEYAAIQAGDDWGAFQETKRSTLAEMKKAGKWYALAEVEAAYGNRTITFTFSFDEEMKLSGIYIR